MAVRVRVGDVQHLGAGQGGHGEAEVRGAVGEIDVQPALDVVRRGGDDQLVDLLVVQHLLDRVHRVMTRRDEAVDVDAGGVLRLPGASRARTDWAAAALTWRSGWRGCHSAGAGFGTRRRTWMGTSAARARIASHSSGDTAMRSVTTRTLVGAGMGRQGRRAHLTAS